MAGLTLTCDGPPEFTCTSSTLFCSPGPMRKSLVSPPLPFWRSAGGQLPGFFFIPLRLAATRSVLTRTSDVCGNSISSPPVPALVAPFEL